MKTSIIILNYNGGEDLEKCVSSVLKTKNQDLEIILVDNGSMDNSHRECMKRFPSIFLIENKKNLGYCEGNNVGVRNANGDFIVILNPDTEVDPEWLHELSKAYSMYGEGLYQPKILDFNNRQIINSTGNSYDIFAFAHQRGFNTIDNGLYDKIEQIGAVNGACFFTSRETFEKIGYFDPYIFAYWDEFNFGWRAAAQYGIKSHYVPNSIVYHKVSQSFEKKEIRSFYFERNRWYCVLTQYSRKTLYKILPALMFLEIISLVYKIFTGKGLKEKISAYRAIIKDRNIIKEKYREQESKKKVVDKEIIYNFMYQPKGNIEESKSMKKIFKNIVIILDKLVRHIM